MSIKGLVLYNGPSELDGEPIVAIATGFSNKTENEKTGDMIQIWIVCRDMNPLHANRLGYDKSICGDCKHRHMRSCYVNLIRGPVQIFEGYHNGSYTACTLDNLKMFKDKDIRIGAYGDPAAVPIHIWDAVCSQAKSWTGYTHQWRSCTPDLRKYCMASTDTIQEKLLATSKGWRTFRVRMEEDPIEPNEFICPASKEAGKVTNCATCQGCKGGIVGAGMKNKPCPVIKVHGPIWRITYFKRGMKRIKNKEKYRIDFPCKV